MPIDAHFLAQAWPGQRLVTFAIPADAEVSADFRELVGRVGVPQDLLPGFEFSFTTLAPEPARGSRAGWRFAQNEGFDFVEARDDATVWMGDGGVPGGTDRFVNQSISKFFECLGLLNKFYADHRDADDDEFARLVPGLVADVQAVDARALEQPSFWWPDVLNQVEVGQF